MKLESVDDAMLAILLAVAQKSASPVASGLFLRFGQSRGGMRDDLRVLMRWAMTDPADEVIRAAAAALPEKLRPAAFAHAADVVLADQKVEQGEKDILGLLAKYLSLTSDAAQRIVDVMLVKNRWRLD